MGAVFGNDEYFEPALYKISEGIKQIIEQKLRCLCERKWLFKGWITHPDYNVGDFELRYDDKNTEESYCIKGRFDISEKFVIKEATCDFRVLNERSQKFVSFQIDFDDKDELADIGDTINVLLKHNRSYRYFCEDYKRYITQKPLQYIKDLLIEQLIDFEEEVYDEGYGSTYHYIGEFGEDLIEIVVDDSNGVGEEAFDFIQINVCDRFHFYLSEYYSEEIRSLMPFLKQGIIPVNDFLIRTNSKYCINKKHRLRRIQALVCVDNGYSIKEVKAEAMFCVECNKYYISELEYEKLRTKGRICSRVITVAEYKKIIESGYHAWAEKSLLRSYDYTVNSKDDLSDIARHRILSFIIENEIMKVEQIVSFLEWLITTHMREQDFPARLKWCKDIAYIRNYKPIEGIVRVRDIYRKRYVQKPVLR